MPCSPNCFSLDFFLGGFKNKSDVCHVLCEELFIDITHSQVHVETEFGVVSLILSVYKFQLRQNNF